ncbi:hypothetical protein [Sphingobium sp. SCG-1]|uniref:hypothetical protein n=1 Tax=Sphingobium sp. SCG-1 TaxID=2072936 RepID=UPI001671095A|nr:hypothetical protein [Sphingobium sp. SCG-1]
MADNQDAFAQVRHRMQTLMQEPSSSARSSAKPRLDEMIRSLGLISGQRRAA